VAGKARYFFPFVIGISHFPMTPKRADSQGQRWVRIVRKLPRMLWLALTRVNVDLFSCWPSIRRRRRSLSPRRSCRGDAGRHRLDWLSTAGLVISTANLLAFGLSLAFAWKKFGRDISLMSLIPSVFGTFRIYGEILTGKTGQDRSKRKSFTS
jgi:hypothetical protein